MTAVLAPIPVAAPPGIPIPVVALGPTSHQSSPSFEGANIRTWIGFKHFQYLVEQALLHHFSVAGIDARSLFLEYGLGWEIVDSSIQLPVALEIGELVTATVTPRQTRDGEAGVRFTVTLGVERDGAPITALKGKVSIALVRERDGGDRPIDPALLPLVIDDVADLAGSDARTLVAEPGRGVEELLVPAGSGGYLWSWRAPYYYCHFSDRLQHSAYVRTLEEVVDRFLADRGLAVGTMLAERAWIPVVSRARVRMLADVHMEEIVHTVFRVEDILRGISYTARMDCWVRRGDELVLAATGTIMHGYAISRGPQAGTVAQLDEQTCAQLLGRPAERT